MAFPHSTTGVSQAELFLRRKPHTRLDVMKSSTGDRTGGTEKQPQQTMPEARVRGGKDNCGGGELYGLGMLEIGPSGSQGKYATGMVQSPMRSM